MSDGRNSPISIMDLPGEPLWFIDRIGDRSLINIRNSNINNNNNHRNTNNNITAMAATYPTNYNYNYINRNMYDDTLIYYPTSLIRSVPSQLVLDGAIEFSEEQCECCICMDQKEAENICQLNCGHSFCVSCIDTSLKTFRDRNQDVICALCRTKVKKITFKKQENKDKIQECL
jgi:hypothetical protein